jgi:ABC-2 type transport system permease protein
MRSIVPLFKREFLGYFRSPVGYVFLAVFLVASVILAFFVGGFFRGGTASLESLFNFYPWLFLFLIPACGCGQRKSAPVRSSCCSRCRSRPSTP